MNRRPIFILFAAVAVIAASISVYELLALRATNVLLRQIAEVKPGVSVDSIRNKLDSEMLACTDVESIIHNGTIKDDNFCKDKKLFLFYSSMPPTRALEVYTDTNNVVVFVSWLQL